MVAAIRHDGPVTPLVTQLGILPPPVV
jgi:hypothetical protein